MKKYILCLAALFAVLFVTAQNRADLGLPYFDREMSYSITEDLYTASTADKIGYSGDSTWNYTVKKWGKNPIYVVSTVTLTRPSVGGSVTVTLNQKCNPSDSYSTKTTKVWYKTSADTVIQIANSAASYVTFTQVNLKGSTATCTAVISKVETKVFE